MSDCVVVRDGKGDNETETTSVLLWEGTIVRDKVSVGVGGGVKDVQFVRDGVGTGLVRVNVFVLR